MKQSKNNITFLLTILFTSALLIFTSCSESGEEDPQQKFVGTWTLDRTVVGFYVNSKTLEQFLIDSGASEEEIMLVQELLISGLEDEFDDDGQIELKSDNTYVANFGNDTDTGTWSFNANTETLTITSSDGDQDIDVISITSSKLVIGLVMSMFGDVDEDGTDDEIEVQMQQEYLK
jgi:hypothetical protein